MEDHGRDSGLMAILLDLLTSDDMDLLSMVHTMVEGDGQTQDLISTKFLTPTKALPKAHLLHLDLLIFTQMVVMVNLVLPLVDQQSVKTKLFKCSLVMMTVTVALRTSIQARNLAIPIEETIAPLFSVS